MHGEVCSLAFLRRRISFGHVTRVRHDEGRVAAHGAAYLQLGGRIARRRAIGELVEQHARLFDHEVVLLLLLAAGWRINAHVARTYHEIVLITLSLQFAPLLFTHLLCGHRILVLAPVELLSTLLLQLLLSLTAQVQHRNCLVQEVVLDLLVDRTISCERRQRIHLNKPRLEFIVNEDVEAEHLEAHRVLHVVWVHGAVAVLQLRLRREHCLNSNVINKAPHLGNSHARLLLVLLNVPENGRDTALVTNVIFS